MGIFFLQAHFSGTPPTLAQVLLQMQQYSELTITMSEREAGPDFQAADVPIPAHALRNRYESANFAIDGLADERLSVYCDHAHKEIRAMLAPGDAPVLRRLLHHALKDLGGNLGVVERSSDTLDPTELPLTMARAQAYLAAEQREMRRMKWQVILLLLGVGSLLLSVCGGAGYLAWRWWS